MKSKIIFFLSLFAVLISSCMSVPKDISYFQEKDEANKKSVNTYEYIEYEPRIKRSDVLLITVTSPTLNQEEVAQFNLPTTSYLAPGESVAMQSTTLQTYIVDKNGNVNYPVIGKVRLGGLTLSDAIDSVTVKVAEYINNPIININILSFKVTVLGEVRNPGPVVVTNSRISILDAIGAAGDLTIYGNRKNVRLIRDNNGQREEAYLDLTSKEVVSSPYFYLEQNDIIVVDPNDTRKRDSKYGQSEYYKLSIFSTVLTGISVITTLILALSK